MKINNMSTGRPALARRTGLRTLGVAVVASAALVLPAGVASAAPAAPVATAGGGQGPAVVGGILQILGFGAVVGVPLGCQLGTAEIGAGAAYLNKASAVSAAIAALNAGCNTVATQGSAYITKAKTADTPLEKIDPFVNPMIGETASSLTQVGTNYGPALAPFGPTIAGLGGTINFFQGA